MCQRLLDGMLDEPTRGLDARLQETFFEILRTTQQRLQIPVVLVTHDLEECSGIADQVYLIENGRFLQSGPKGNVFSRPANSDIARALGIFNVMPATIASLDPGKKTSRVRMLESEIEGPYFPGRLIGDQGFVCVQRSELELSAPKQERSANQLKLRIRAVTSGISGVRVQFEGGMVAYVSETKFASLREHDDLNVTIPASAVYFVGK